MFTESISSTAEGKVAVMEKEHSLGNQPAMLERDILESLYYVQGKTKSIATIHDWYMAVAFTVRCRLMNNWVQTLHNLQEKKIKSLATCPQSF